MFGGTLRLLYIGVNHWRSVLLVGGILFVIGSGIAVASEVPMEEETVPSSVGTITVEQQHHARVIGNATLYQPGETLHGKQLYLYSDTPNVTVQEVVRTDDRQPTTVGVETRLVYLARYADSVVYRERGASIRKNGTVANGNVTVSMELNMTQVRAQVRELRGKFSSETSVRAVLLTRVGYNAQPSDSIVFRVPIELTTKGYHVPETTESQRYGTFETIRKPVPERTISVDGIVVGHIRLFGLALALIGLCTVGVSAGYLRRVTDADKEALYRDVMHQRFSEFIATVDAGECPTVVHEMESLQDLIYVSEDSGEPVLYFPDADRYIVDNDGTVYGYRFETSVFMFGDSSN